MKSESEVAQSCPTLSNPMDCSLQGFSVHGIFQARVLEWGAIASSSFKYNLYQSKSQLYLEQQIFQVIKMGNVSMYSIKVYFYIIGKLTRASTLLGNRAE